MNPLIERISVNPQVCFYVNSRNLPAPILLSFDWNSNEPRPELQTTINVMPLNDSFPNPESLKGLSSIKIYFSGDNPGGIERILQKTSQIKSLTSVQITMFNLEKFPLILSKLPQLKELIIEGSKITEIPADYKFNKLDILKIKSQSSFFKIESLSNINNLKELHLKLGMIEVFPNKLNFSTSLEKLTLDVGGMTNVPIQITQFNNLKSLTLGGRIKTIPDFIDKLTHLEELCILSSELVNEWIYPVLEQLKRIELASAFMIEDVDFLAKMPNVEEVFIKGANLKEFSMILNIQGLKKVSLIGCNITELSKEILLIKSLEYLDIRNNKVNSLPEGIGKMPSLKIIRISKHSPPKGIDYLEQTYPHIAIY
jgi:Leucine-rich repeat (LRR) protein